MKLIVIAVLLLTITTGLFAAELNEPALPVSTTKRGEKEKQLQEFITAHVAKVAPMLKEANLIYWAAATTGKEEEYKKLSELQLEIHKIYMNPQEFAMLKEMKESGQIQDSAVIAAAGQIILCVFVKPD